MSADNGYVLRRNQAGNFILQEYSASADSYPDVENPRTDEIFGTVEEAIKRYAELERDPYFICEYGLSIQLGGGIGITATSRRNKKMQTQKFSRKPFEVEAIQVTEENLGEVASWCQGHISAPSPAPSGLTGRFIKVNVRNPMTPKQTEAHVGDWVLLGRQGFKVYTDSAFKKNFVRGEEDVPNTTVTNIFADFSDTNPLPNPREKFKHDAIQAQHRMSEGEFSVFNNGNEPVTELSPDASDQQ